MNLSKIEIKVLMFSIINRVIRYIRENLSKELQWKVPFSGFLIIVKAIIDLFGIAIILPLISVVLVDDIIMT